MRPYASVLVSDFLELPSGKSGTLAAMTYLLFGAQLSAEEKLAEEE